MNDTATNDAGVYLQIMPRFEADPRSQRWHVFRVSDESPRITLAGSVSSCKEAQALAAQNKRPLRIAEQAWQQMVAAHAAPKTVPDGVTVTWSGTAFCKQQVPSSPGSSSACSRRRPRRPGRRG